jgi:hypothetical protein
VPGLKIERIYILTHAKDIRWARCCVASIRRWYPEIAITLIKDENKGAFSTEDLERYWDVERFQTPRKLLGYGFGKLEPLFEKRRERCLILDSDTVFLGRVLEALEKWDEDFIVDQSVYPAEEVRAHYLDIERLRVLEPQFQFPGYVFNTGQFVATTGILAREDFAPYVTFGNPAQVLHGDVFKAGDQGILNFTVLRKAQAGEITLRRTAIMGYPVAFQRDAIALDRLTADSPYPLVMHWAGPKAAFFSQAQLGYILTHFEAAYYSRIPRGTVKRLRVRCSNLMEVVKRERPWKGYA